MRFWKSLTIAAILLPSLGPKVYADGAVRNGVGAISLGRGGTNIASADNAVMLLDNPAGMVNVAHSGMTEIGFDILVTDLEYSDPDNHRVAAEDDPFPMGHAGWIRKSASGDFAYGIGVFAPAGFSAKYTAEGPAPFTGPRLYKSLAALLKVLPGAAVRVNERLSVGATFGVAVNHMELESPYFLQGPSALASVPTEMDVQATGAAPTWTFGMQYQLTPATTVGMSYKSETRFHLDGSTRVRVPVLGRSTYDATLDATWPRSLGLGLAHCLCEHGRVTADVVWFNWSKAFDNFGLRLRNPSTPGFPPTLVEHYPLDWNDSVAVRTGYEYPLNECCVLRTQTIAIQTMQEHSVTLGAGWQHCGWRCDFAYEFSTMSRARVGASDLLGDDFANAVHEADAHWIALSAQKQF